MKDKVFEYTLLLGVQETIAGFINDHVIPEDDEIHLYPQGFKPIPNKDEHLYELWVRGQTLYNH